MHPWRFLQSDTDLSAAISGEYVPGFVLLSVSLAIIAAYAALEVVERASTAERKQTRYFWIALGALCLGFGIWSMHFIGMMGFKLPVPVSYEPVMTAISVLPAIVASLFALTFLTTRTDSLLALVVAGALIAAGIGSMHYLGMEAMHGQGLQMLYAPGRFVGSIVVAILLAISALLIRCRLAPRLGLGARVENALGGLVLGSAVSGMHYVAMTATWFLPGGDHPEIIAPTGESLVGVAIAAIVVALTLAVIVSVFVDRRLRSLGVVSELIVVPVFVVILFLLLTYISTVVVRSLEKQVEKEISVSLNTVLETSVEALAAWQKQHIAAVSIWADADIIRSAARELTAAWSSPEELAEREAQQQLRAWFPPIERRTKYRGYFLIDREGRNIASSRNQNLGVSNLLLVQPEFLESLWAGNANVSLPVTSEVPLPNESGVLESAYPTMFVGAPVYDERKQVIAAFMFRIDPMDDFVGLLHRGRVGESGETYAFDKNGRLLSESRYDEEFRSIGLLGKSQRGMLNLTISNPGADIVQGQLSLIPPNERPLTLMVQQAIKAGRGSNSQGYRDYRGAPVVGAWQWIDDARLGLATEQALGEAKSSFFLFRTAVIGLTAATAISLFLLVIILTLSRVRQLEASRRTSAILETTVDGVLTWDEVGTIESCNRSGNEMFAAGDAKVEGRLLETLIPELEGRSYKDVRIFFGVPDDKPLTFQMETKGCRVDGSQFPLEISVSETFLPSGERLFTGILRDIAERKRVEAELLSATTERQRLEADLNIARDIQHNMLPMTFPPFPDRDDVDIYAALKPAWEVGGDFYDFFELDDGRICFAIGDVSGKGIPAALFMTLAKTLVKSRTYDDPDPARVLTRVNEDLCKGNDANMFVTLFVAVLDPSTGHVVYSNGGHNPPYVLTDSGELIVLDARHGPVIGAVEGISYGVDEIALSQGDTLLMYTDGVTEAMNGNRELFGEERLVELLKSLRYESATQIVKTFIDQVAFYEGEEADQTDDITVQAVRLVHDQEHSRVWVLELTLDNRIEEINRVNEHFNEIASEHGVSASITQKFNIVFDELLSNIIYHGNGGEEGARIRIRIELLSDRIKVAISSYGIPFDPSKAEVPDTSLGLDERDPGGLGIYIVKNLVDEMVYHRRINQNVINLLKYLGDSDSISGG